MPLPDVIPFEFLTDTKMATDPINEPPSPVNMISVLNRSAKRHLFIFQGARAKKKKKKGGGTGRRRKRGKEDQKGKTGAGIRRPLESSVSQKGCLHSWRTVVVVVVIG